MAHKTSCTQTFMTADTQGAMHKTAKSRFGADKGTMVSQHYHAVSIPKSTR